MAAAFSPFRIARLIWSCTGETVALGLKQTGVGPAAVIVCGGGRKNPQILRSFVTDRGKMIPRRISGASARQQRVISTAIRRARMLALLPFTVTGD